MTSFRAEALLLVAITDDLHDGVDGLLARARAAERGGATMIQLRLKDEPPRTIVEVARVLVSGLAVPVIINDRADVALAAGAAGVHLGVDDVPPAALRPLVPPGFVLGASVGSQEEVEHADGADYVGIGPVFDTATKSDAGAAIGVAGFQRLARLTRTPAVAIGGITAETTPELLAAGAAGVAVIRAIFGAADAERAAASLRSATGR